MTPDEQAMLDWRFQQNARDPLSDWKTHIEFNGLVVNESNQPLSGATIVWDTTTADGNNNGSTTSGPDGRFLVDTIERPWISQPAKGAIDPWKEHWDLILDFT